MIITALMDDYCPKGRLRGEHGLSYLLETEGLRLLFDAGQTDAILHNARGLGIELSSLDAIVLSHGHYDHSGGLGALYASIAPASPRLLAGKGYSTPKRSRTDAGLADIGIPEASMPPRVPPAEELAAALELRPGFYIMPRAELADGFAPSPRFRILEGGTEYPDPFDDEVSLAVEGDDGLVVVTGCAHRGIVNIVAAARRQFPGRPLAALVGGFHLSDASDETLDRVAGEIASLSPRRILCGHCTGVRGFAAIASRNRGVGWLACGMRAEL